MKVNPKIKEVLDEISKETVVFFNTDSPIKKSKLRKIYRFFKRNLTEEEQLYVINYLLENIHYKNVLIDPETLIITSNIKLRFIFSIVVSTIIVMVVFAMLFNTNSSLNFVVEVLKNLLSAINFAK
jgi:sugar-specific transcriptional regulator TrmB